MIKFIHIGKCGGTTIKSLFGLYEYHHIKPIIDPSVKYVIWIRNPLDRFVSAFNMSHYLVHLDVSTFDINNLTLDNCLAPNRIKFKKINGYTFEPNYDDLIRTFHSANHLAEALSDEDIKIKNKAIALMNYDCEHIYKSIGWYLDNGDFVEKYHDQILMVGKTETMKDDVVKLATLLKKQINSKNVHERENKNQDKYLSELAVKNLLEFYKESDYRTLNILHKYNFIDDDMYKSYHKYT